jgi:Tfp pilus assembly protein PilF
VILLAFLAVFPTLAAQTEATNAVVVEVEGRALLARAGSDDWQSPRVGQPLLTGDRFRTLEHSRAVIRLTDLSLLRLGELSHIQIPAPTNRRGGLQFLRGILYYFHRDRPGVMPITTPSAHAVVLGTEFVMAVGDDGVTQLTMLDGRVTLNNEGGSLDLTNGQSGQVQAQLAPRRIPALAPATTLQWVLYYPGVVDLADLDLSPATATALEGSLAAYRAGDLPGALAAYPMERVTTEPAEQLYRASLLLVSGLVEPASTLLTSLRGAGPTNTNTVTRLAASVERMVRIVQLGSVPPGPTPETATEWLVESYARQARSDLPGARAAAREAVQRSPQFAFAWAQLADLEFSFGRAAEARLAAQRSRTLAPRLARAFALEGFALAAQHRVAAASRAFEEAITLNGAMGDAWLGRGLCRLRLGDRSGGRDDLQVAATVEPQRAILRSYLAKAWDETGDGLHARHELDLAQELDPHDPTAWLYSALLRQRQNQINEGIADLERSMDLNDERSLFRSRLLLDQDQAVRAANLAALYRDAGLAEIGRASAARATEQDYANAAAHLFLANSYHALRDPNLAQLRYETPAVSEYLMANLLAPVGGSGLSPMISQQEYSPLFDGNRVGLASETAYTSDGSWAQSGAHYGVLNNFSYALEGAWRSTPGHRRNSDLEQFVGAGHFKVQLSPQTSAYLLTSYSTLESGDVRSYYDDRQASTGLRLEERQEPNIFAGLNHQWAPGVHTLLLAAHLNDTLHATDPSTYIPTLVRDAGGTLTGVVNPADSRFGVRYRSELQVWSSEVQQIVERPGQLWLMGARLQSGEVETRAVVRRDPLAFPPVFTDPAAQQRVADPLERISVYGYGQWQVLDPLRLLGGVSYDWLKFPLNANSPPLLNGAERADQFSPKAGFEWGPLTNLHLRGAYTRSLGGFSFDNSVRLEPTQLAGFIQSYRSLLPESRAGQVPGTAFETFHLGLDHRLPSRTYWILEGELLRSEGRRSVGVFDYTDSPPFLAVPSSLRQHLDFEERSVALGLHQLLGAEWALSARYRLADAAWRAAYVGVPASVDPSARTSEAALLHQADLAVYYQHSSGFFGQAEARWRRQDNREDAAALRDDDFWQFDVWVGWRLARRRVEIAVGGLNLTDRNYRLNPLNATADLPHERLFATRLRWSF